MSSILPLSPSGGGQEPGGTEGNQAPEVGVLRGLAYGKVGRITRRSLARIAYAVPLLLGIITISFFLTHVLPGDPARLVAGPFAPQSQVNAIRRSLGLTGSIFHQYGVYLQDLAHGNLGKSLTSGTPVTTEIGSRLGPTLELITLGALFALVYGIGIGAAVAYARGARLWKAVVSLGQACPDFVFGLVLIFVFFFELHLLPPPVGQLGFLATPPAPLTHAVAVDALLRGDWSVLPSALSHLVLPVVTLGIIYGSPVARVAANAFQEAERLPYITYARLSGLSARRVFRYRLRAAFSAIVTVGGVVYGYLLGGAVLVEIIFSWGGLGQYAATSILNLDIPAIQGFVLVAGVFSLFIYLLLDIAYMIIDPRASAQ